MTKNRSRSHLLQETKAIRSPGRHAPCSPNLLDYISLPFLHLSAPPDKTQDRYESQNASQDSKQQKRELVSYLITQIHGVERESEAEGLADKIE